MKKVSDYQAHTHQVAKKRGGQLVLADTVGNSRRSTSRELLILDDTEVKTGEQTIATTFLPEMVVDIRKSA